MSDSQSQGHSGQGQSGEGRQSSGASGGPCEVYELERRLAALDAQPQADVRQRIDLLNRLAWELSDTDSKRAFALSEAAYDLASAFPPDEPATQAAIAYSLRTQGYLNQRLGNHLEGIKQLARALAIFEPLGCTDGLTDVYDGLAGIHAQIGNLPEALGYIHRQLAAAEQIGDSRRIANAYNNLAFIYNATGEFDRALAIQQQNLQLAEAIGYARIECISNLNLASTYLNVGKPEQASAYALAGLRHSREAGFEVFAVFADLMLGSLSLQQNDPLQAIRHLEQALTTSKTMESRVTESQVLIELGRVYQAMQCFEQARSVLQEAIAVAESIDARSELSVAHQVLSEVHEQMGDSGQALAHFKQYHAAQELVTGEKANQRLQVLQVAHDTKQARKEAEIAQLHAVELQKEVAARTVELTDTIAQLQNEVKERQRAEAEIQQMVETLERRIAERTDELATFFDLTLLAGQSGDLGDVLDQALPRILEVTRSQALCIHLLDAQRTTLRLVGQQNLTGAAQPPLQAVQLTRDLRRWMQQPSAPLITTDLLTSALPPALRLPGFQTYLGAQIKISGHIEGLLSCYRLTDQGYGVDEVALVMALAEQFGMMLATQRLRRSAAEMAVLAERQRLARDLHDSVTQTLYSLALFSRAGREAAADGDTVRLTESLSELEENTLHVLREMRLLLYELRPADLQREGLKRALELRLNTVERRAGLQLDVQLADLPAFPPQFEMDLYHIIVEALNNVVKHAAATCLTLHLQRRNGHLHLRIVDDGYGFDPAQVKGGMGLSNMRERVARLDGQLSVVSALGCGVRLEVVVPEPREGK